MIASLLLAGACAANLNAQEKTNYYTPKWSDNIFVSVGGGIHAINNDGFNKIAPHFSVSVGKLITPTWGVRAQVNGITQHLCLDDAYWEHNKTYVGGNIDAMINLSTLFAGANPNRFFEVYGFLGPQISVAKSQNVDVTISADGFLLFFFFVFVFLLNNIILSNDCMGVVIDSNQQYVWMRA